MFKSNNYKTMVILGSQWGDEGKGKITDYFAQNADYVVRFAGGDNAGHVIVSDGVKYKVTIVPSGILNPKTTNIIGNGTVVNIDKLMEEIDILEKSNVNTNKLLISDRAHVVFEYNQTLDALQEKSKKTRKIGTTKRGIGPTYSDKAQRIGIRICDFADPEFKDILKENFDYHKDQITKIYEDKFDIDFENFYKKQMHNFETIKNRVIDGGQLIQKVILENKKVLFEGAQGALLDIDHGTYPYVTSSNTTANNVSVGTGIHAKLINKVVGITKAYNSRVGNGAMPTELDNEIGERIRVNGNEYGSNTKRPRRVGWLDLVALKYAIRTGGIDELFITLLDVLDAEEEIKLCTSYEYEGKAFDTIPASNNEFGKCKPVFETLPGWKQDITQTTSWDQLPENAKKYLSRISEFCEIDILGFSVGPDRKQTIMIKEEFNND
ncbi:adenylosuccinate synthase [Mesoplasma corruscae]|uniref:Adenylosuccinate synthetase n=1 Tax=Mesoplasma corruscae TaxID=216874 RepID=A0A2S5RGK7_9MOLU|nr:adenylosuccinate synthase [Mesoplasma corruscae]PPE06466.1 adenylosuccinate synthetase [Mesoplasma corruscae]